MNSRQSQPAIGRRGRAEARAVVTALGCAAVLLGAAAVAQENEFTDKPAIHGQHWVAISGKPLATTAGALIFARGGNAVDAASAMLAASATMWDMMGWGGETQALIYNPETRRVIGINALGVAPTGATPEYFLARGMEHPPEYGPLAAVTPGTPGGLLVMLAEFGRLSLAEVLEPAIEMARGYPMERSQSETIGRWQPLLQRWPSSRAVFLPHVDALRPDRSGAPRPGELFSQPDLLATLEKLVEAERAARAAGSNRREAILAAYDRFYRGDIAEELVRATQAGGGLITMEDLDRWQVHIEEPRTTSYRGVDVYKLDTWTQGPVLLQTLNILENMDLRGMGYNSTRYIHAVNQAMNLAFADRDFYYGDPYSAPATPIDGLLSKDYARQRFGQIAWDANDPAVRPGDPYPFQGQVNPYTEQLQRWQPLLADPLRRVSLDEEPRFTADEAFRAGTTSIQAADADGWVVSITPSGAWIPVYIAGSTGIGLSQRMQSFGFDPERNPFNVLEPGKRPRVTLTPSLALRDGEPYLAFAVQGGDAQDQNLLQFFLNVFEFGMDVQQATEAANFNSYQMHTSFGNMRAEPGRLLVRADTPARIIAELTSMGYAVETWEKTSGPINAIWFDKEHGTLWGGSSNFGEDHGIGW
jgi:gamma-glutamyltranspeptidase / glutathione hydrolase